MNNGAQLMIPRAEPTSGVAAAAMAAAIREDMTAEQLLMDQLRGKQQETLHAAKLLSEHQPNERMWLCLGDLFVKLPQPTAGALIRSDLDQLGLEAANIARSIESKRQTLRQLSASPSMR